MKNSQQLKQILDQWVKESPDLLFLSTHEYRERSRRYCVGLIKLNSNLHKNDVDGVGHVVATCDTNKSTDASISGPKEFALLTVLAIENDFFPWIRFAANQDGWVGSALAKGIVWMRQSRVVNSKA